MRYLREPNRLRLLRSARDGGEKPHRRHPHGPCKPRRPVPAAAQRVAVGGRGDNGLGLRSPPSPTWEQREAIPLCFFPFVFPCI